MIPLCSDLGVGVLPYSPLARGLLAGARPDGAPTTRAQSDPVRASNYGEPGDAEVIESVERLAQERDTSPAKIALAWLLHQPGVTAPIVGATRLSHIDDAIAASTVPLTPDDLTALTEHYRPRCPDRD
jgi:1-deoxyxylulose-5-phosphate synthase